MNQEFDILRIDNGEALWVAVESTLDDAKMRAEECCAKYFCECWIIDKCTGMKHIVGRDGSVRAAGV